MIDYYDVSGIDCNESQNEREKGNEKDKGICFRSSTLGLAIFLGPLNPPREERHEEESLTWRVEFFLVPLNLENCTWRI